MSVPTISIFNSKKGKINSSYEIISADVSLFINKIPFAQLVLLDVDIYKEAFKISAEGFFDPGEEIVIKLEYLEDNPRNRKTVFKGIIVQHKIEFNSKGALLILELKGSAFTLTTQRNSALFTKTTDSKIITQLLEKCKALTISGKVAETKPEHEQMVQYYCSDWDFILVRAEANGLWVMHQYENEGYGAKEKIAVVAPTLQGKANHIFDPSNSSSEVQILEFEMEMDIRHQVDKVSASRWDYAALKLSAQNGSDFDLKQGDLNSNEIGKKIGASQYNLMHLADLKIDELKAWANAKLMKNRLSMFKGRFALAGNTSFNLGQKIKIEKVTKHFDGETFITGIRHQINAQGWKTHVQFGLSSEWFAANPTISDMPAAGLLPAVHGLQIGIVADYEEEGEGYKIKVELPIVPVVEGQASDNVILARLASVYASNNLGVVFRPEIGDEVILGFFNNDPRQAVILGSLHSKTKPPPIPFTRDNNKKGIFVKQNNQLFFDDKEKTITLQNDNKNKFCMTNEKGILLEDENSNQLNLSKDLFTIKGSKDIQIEGKNITIQGEKIENK